MTAPTTAVRPAAGAAWRRIPRPAPHAAVRLYAFPHAGGSAAAVQGWAAHLPPSVELRAIQLPGRHDRMAEEAHTEAGPLAAELLAALRPELSEAPFAFFGHSMGAMLALRLAQQLARSGGPLPVLTGVSGWAPDTPDRCALPDADLPAGRFTAAVRALGGLPAEILASPELLDLVLPTLRADFRVCAGYRPLELPPLPCPFVGYTGDRDPLVSPAGMANWARRTGQWLGTTVHPGDHFYLAEHAPAVLADFTRRLREMQRPPATARTARPAPLPVP